MEAFGICARGLESTTHLPVHMSAIRRAELLDFFRKLNTFYELYGFRESLVELYKDHVTEHFTPLCTCARKIVNELLPLLDVITP